MEGPLEVWCGTPLFLLIASWPLWLTRAAVGIRMVSAEEPPDAEPRSARQYTIGDLIVATLVVAVSLGLVRTHVALEGRGRTIAQEERVQSDLQGILEVAAVASIYNAVVAVPCAWAALGARRRLRAAVLLAVYAVLFVFGLCGWQYWDSGGRVFFDRAVVLMGVSVLALVYASFWSLRQAGVALRRSRPSRKAAPQRTGIDADAAGADNGQD